VWKEAGESAFWSNFEKALIVPLPSDANAESKLPAASSVSVSRTPSVVPTNERTARLPG
jgi:hypothetical protein